MSDPIEAVTEAAATGETAELFADIRAVYGVSTVNLIWRHLATIPGALPHVWGGLRPLYLDGTLAREAAALRVELRLPAAEPMQPSWPQEARLDAIGANAVRQVLAAYDRTNPMALIALCAARARLAGTPAPEWRPGPAPPPAEPELRLPRLLDLAEMPELVADFVTRMNRFGSTKPQPLMASMYRHLAHWPGFLALAFGYLVLHNRDRGLHAAIADGLGCAEARAAALPRVADAPPLDPDLVPRVDAALALFTTDPIARMLVVTRMLRRAVG